MFFKKEAEGYLGTEWKAEELSMIVVNMGKENEKIRFVKLFDDNTAQFVTREKAINVEIWQGCGFRKVDQLKVSSFVPFAVPYGSVPPIWLHKDIKSVAELIDYHNNDRLLRRRLDPLAVTGQELLDLEQYVTKKIWDHMDEEEKANNTTPLKEAEYDNMQEDDVRFERIEENTVETL